MAGHSHWANIQHKKSAVDRRRAKVHSKIARKVIQAAKQGGGDPGMNLKLKYALQAARAANMSNDQVNRAIQRAVGGTQAEDFEELVYEGYAPGGAAVLVEALTDNRNRTGGDVRAIFTKHGGNLGQSGSVAWQFDFRAQVRVPASETTEDELMGAVLDAGASDIEQEGDSFVVHGPPEALSRLQQAVEGAGIASPAAEVAYVPKDYVPVDDQTARRVAALLEALEENDDVQQVYTNADFPEDFEG